jgi:hypothetical protein
MAAANAPADPKGAMSYAEAKKDDGTVEVEPELVELRFAPEPKQYLETDGMVIPAGGTFKVSPERAQELLDLPHCEVELVEDDEGKGA